MPSGKRKRTTPPDPTELDTNIKSRVRGTVEYLAAYNVPHSKEHIFQYFGVTPEQGYRALASNRDARSPTPEPPKRSHKKKVTVMGPSATVANAAELSGWRGGPGVTSAQFEQGAVAGGSDTVAPQGVGVGAGGMGDASSGVIGGETPDVPAAPGMGDTYESDNDAGQNDTTILDDEEHQRPDGPVNMERAPGAYNDRVELLDPPEHIAVLRETMFHLRQPLTLTPEEQEAFWPYMDNIWSFYKEKARQAKPLSPQSRYRCRLHPTKSDIRTGDRQRNRTMPENLGCPAKMKVVSHRQPEVDANGTQTGKLIPVSFTFEIVSESKHNHTLEEVDLRKLNSAVKNHASMQANRPNISYADVAATLKHESHRQTLLDCGGVKFIKHGLKETYNGAKALRERPHLGVASAGVPRKPKFDRMVAPPQGPPDTKAAHASFMKVKSVPASERYLMWWESSATARADESVVYETPPIYREGLKEGLTVAQLLEQQSGAGDGS
ncbi:hypothetical protein MBLNU230_g1618t1 [Neophaeotheca triangularis]